MWKRLAIIALALALGVVFASVVGATNRSNPDRPPEFLPREIKESATPMPGTDLLTAKDSGDLGCEIWQILELHRIRNDEAAMTAWNELTLPPGTAVWKWIALGQASIATDRLEQARRVSEPRD